MNVKRKIMNIGLGIECIAVFMAWICVLRGIAVPSYLPGLICVGLLVTMISAFAIRKENKVLSGSIKDNKLILFLILLFVLTVIITFFSKI